MIYASFMGNFGNCLFQYCFSRMLQERMKYALTFEPESIAKLTKHFPGVVTAFPGAVMHGPDFIVGEGTMRHSRTMTMDELAWVCQGEVDKRLRVVGYFERSYWYLPERDKIRSWIPVEHLPIGFSVVNIRGGDRRDHTLEEADYYRKAVNMVLFRPVIVTDDPDWDFVRSFGLQVYHRTPLVDFELCASAPELVIGRSTFSWWAAFLGRKGQRVIQPEPQTLWRCPGEYFYGYLGVPEWEKVAIP